jgi:hypothetical protein
MGTESLHARLTAIRAAHPAAQFVETPPQRSRPSRVTVSFSEETADGLRFGSYVLDLDGRVIAAAGAAVPAGAHLELAVPDAADPPFQLSLLAA